MSKVILLIAMLCCGTLVQAQQYSFPYDGTTRSYLVHLPSGYTAARAYPLVLNFHGLTSTGAQQQYSSGMDAVSDANGFIVVYPNGLNNSWNAGINNANVDDIGFVNRLLDVLAGQYSVDAQRVYATGFSMGGYFSYRLACQLSNRIAAVAPVSGLQLGSCAPVRSVPVLHIHGTSDPIVSYSQVAGSLNYWRNRNGCTAAAQTTSLPNGVDLTVYGGCTQGAEVRHYRINGGGHSWPRTSLNGSQVIWTFFNRFTLNVQPSNPAPVVSITAPASNAAFSAPASISITANATDANGTVARVEFFQGSTKLGEDLTSPYAFTWTAVGAGTYSLTARATDNEGAVTNSAAVAVTVTGTGGDICAGVPAYSSTANNYVVGSKVTGSNQLYECRSAGRCNGWAYYYAPGTGIYWRYAWTLQGTCSSSRAATVDEDVVSVYPNPAVNQLEIDFNAPTAAQVKVSLTSMLAKDAVNSNFSAHAGENKLLLDVSKLPAGLHILTVVYDNEIIVKRIHITR
ncbi:hypothetical protein GCM10022409_45640 [Hymenobacter glaciei]|uniref:Secretion system C-terminal sorting domain-containing protein n=1 Tax=Hymenobacter glaciei TaxID=877209 RepID=A0ABP7UVA2_9BACT